MAVSTDFMACSPQLPRNRKLRYLAADLGEKRHATIGRLFCVWAWAFFFVPDGNLNDEDPDEIEREAGWEGEPGVFLAALRARGFIDEQGEIHDWFDWGGRLHALRDKDAERKRDERKKAAKSKPPGTVPPSGGGPSTDDPGTVRAQGEEKKEKKEKKEIAGGDDEKKGALAVYRAAWTARYGEEPRPSRADVLAVHAALKPFPPERREQIVRAFVEDDDPWLIERAHRLGLLPGQLDRIRAGLNGKLSGGKRRLGESDTPPNYPEGELWVDPVDAAKVTT